jgi:hypothetical protein
MISNSTIGIGTNAPSAQLDVRGNVIVSGTHTANSIVANSNMGVGTQNPRAKLDVNGEIMIGNSGLGCQQNTVGAIRYNSQKRAPEYCDGTAWRDFLPGECKTVKASGGPPSYVSVAVCPQGTFLKTGGGTCEVPGSKLCASITLGFMHSSFPDGNQWVVDCFSTDLKGESCSEAHAVCCRQ